MAELALLQRQREVSRTFRQASAQRAKAETDAEARHRADRQTADAALNQARQAPATQLAGVHKYQEQGREILANASLQLLLQQPLPPTVHSGTNPGQELVRSLTVATAAPASIQAGIQALQKWRQQATASRRELLTYVAVGVLFILVASGYFGYLTWLSEQQSQQQYRSALAALEAGQYEQARAKLEQLISKDPNYEDAQVLLRESYYRPALIYLNAEEWGKAEAELEILVKFYAGYRDAVALLKEAYYLAGVNYLSAGEEGKAEAELLKLLREYGNYRNVMELLTTSIQISKLSITGVEASSDYQLKPLENTIDGNTETSWPLDNGKPWLEGGGPIDSVLEMTLARPAVVTQIRLYTDASTGLAQIKAATISFSDGSTQSIQVNGTSGWHEILLAPVITSSVHIRVTEIDRPPSEGAATPVVEVIDVALYGYQ